MICQNCKKELPEKDFSIHTGTRRRKTCKKCRAEIASRKYNESDKKYILQKAKEYKEHRRLTHRGHYLVTAAKQRAKTKKVSFDLDRHLDNIQARIDAGFCEITGIPFDLIPKQGWNSPSLDRIDPKKGYILSNVRVVLFSLNIMMHDWGLETVKKIMKRI